MNSDAPQPEWPTWGQAERRVLEHQRKLHRWARSEPGRRFADVFNLICDRATLLVAWERVAGNKGAMTAGVDAVTRYAVVRDDGLIPFLEGLRTDLRQGRFTPLPVRQTTIPKKGGKVRYLGIPTLGTGWRRWHSSWSWNRSSRPSSTRPATGIGLGGGMISFWTTRMAAMFELYMLAELLLSGRLVPLPFMPEPVRQVADWLPFKWTFAFPIEALIGQIDARGLVLGLLAQAAWIAALGGLLALVWRRAVRTYSAVGN